MVDATSNGKVLEVFLCDLQNSYYRYIRNSVPIGMGYVAAYLKQEFGDAVRLHLFRKFEDVHAALQETTPALVAFGSYSWNTQLTARTIEYLRRRFPEVSIALAGPDVSPMRSLVEKDMRRQPEADFWIANEAEAPCRNLVQAMLGGASRADMRTAGVDGCLSMHPDAPETVTGNLMSRFDADINDIPSPYLGGMMDDFLANPDYLPIIQTARGCPYGCTFCVSGKDIWSKVKAFDMDRVRAEIDYVAEKAANRYMRFADENFGILRRDVEIAEYLMKKRRDTGFPRAVSIYTDKHPTERVKQINELMRDLMPFCISYQSATKEVLDNIKRINLKDKMVEDAIAFAREKDLLLVSELIFALPGESVETFLSSIDQLIDYRFESIAINQLRILKGTVMDSPADREKYQVETMFSMSENGYTNHPELENIEIDEWVVANSTMTREDFFSVNEFILLFDFAHYRGFLKELLFYFELSGVRASRVMMEAVRNPARYPTICSATRRFSEGMQRILQPTPDDAREYVRDQMAKDPSGLEGIYRLEDRLMIDILMEGKLDAVTRELSDAAGVVHEREKGPVPSAWSEELNLLCKLLSACHISLAEPSPSVVTIEADYDLAGWATDRYQRPLSEYRTEGLRACALEIRNPENYQDLWNNEDSLLDRYKRHFATINSSNRRRFITSAKAVAA